MSFLQLELFALLQGSHLWSFIYFFVDVEIEIAFSRYLGAVILFYEFDLC